MTYSNRNQLVVTVLIHVTFIMLMCFLPDILHRYSRASAMWSMSQWTIARAAVIIAVFYLNYLVIIPQLLVRRRKWVSFILLNVVICAAAALLVRYLSHLEHLERVQEMGEMARRFPGGLPAIDWLSFFLRDFVMQILVCGLAVALSLTQQWYVLQQKHQQALVLSRESELAGLRQQLNPHFLFNTLNSIYALIEISPEDAQRAVHDLSRLLRYMVYENPERVAFEREVEFISTFIELMRLRMSDRPINFEVKNNAPAGTTIAPLVFITQVENALKHGNTSNHSQPIDITIRASKRCIECITVNSVDKHAHRDSGHGVGLANLRRRLEIIYGDDAEITTSTENNRYHTHLKINLI